MYLFSFFNQVIFEREKIDHKSLVKITIFNINYIGLIIVMPRYRYEPHKYKYIHGKIDKESARIIEELGAKKGATSFIESLRIMIQAVKELQEMIGKDIVTFVEEIKSSIDNINEKIERIEYKIDKFREELNKEFHEEWITKMNNIDKKLTIIIESLIDYKKKIIDKLEEINNININDIKNIIQSLFNEMIEKIIERLSRSTSQSTSQISTTKYLTKTNTQSYELDVEIEKVEITREMYYDKLKQMSDELDRIINDLTECYNAYRSRQLPILPSTKYHENLLFKYNKELSKIIKDKNVIRDKILVDMIHNVRDKLNSLRTLIAQIKTELKGVKR